MNVEKLTCFHFRNYETMSFLLYQNAFIFYMEKTHRAKRT